jgi:A/G-specific adenine glycosylase
MGEAERYPNLAKKKNAKQKIRRYWIESKDGLLLYSTAKGSTRLAGIYELPENLPVELKNLARGAKHLVTRKRTIGQVDYEEEIFRTDAVKGMKDSLPVGYRWVLRPGMADITLSGPHRKWIKELWDKPNLGVA